jgi:hypothetical protein
MNDNEKQQADGNRRGDTFTASNSPVVFKSIDFADFSTSSTIEFRLYGYNVASSTGGIRYDDIKLFGANQAWPAEQQNGPFSGSSCCLEKCG